MTFDVTLQMEPMTLDVDFGVITDDGYDRGHEAGYKEGYETGVAGSYDVGYQAGEADGYDKGYDKGYSEGHARIEARIDCSLTELISDRETFVATYAFYNCELEFVDLAAVTAIYAHAFNGNYPMYTFVLRSSTVCTLASTNAFYNGPIKWAEGYIYVPSDLLSDYKKATNWSTYAAQFRALEEYTVDGTTTGAFDRSKI